MARLASFSVVFLAGAAQGYSLAAAVPQQQQHAQRSSLSIAMVSRRTAGLAEQVDQDKLYQPAEAVALMKKLASAKFVETAELHGNLNLDPKYNDQQIRTTVSLPHGTGNAVRVAVLAEGAAADAAKEAGADVVGFDDLIETIAGGTLDFDVLLATPPAMPKLAKLGKVLGPKGLMPSPKAGTVSATPGEAVAEFKAGKLEFRTDKQGIVHVPFGKVSACACVCVWRVCLRVARSHDGSLTPHPSPTSSLSPQVDFTEDKLTENLMALAATIDKNRPTGCKGKLWNTATLSSTMGPGIKLDLASLKSAA